MSERISIGADELLDLFQGELSSVGVAARRDERDSRPNLPRSHDGSSPVFVFEFVNSPRVLLIGYTRRDFKAAVSPRTFEDIDDFANSLNEEELLIRLTCENDDLHAIFDLGMLICPIDPIIAFPIALKSLVLVEEPSEGPSRTNAIVGIVMNFQHGFQLTFVSDPNSEPSILVGAWADAALAQAEALASKGRLRIRRREYPMLSEAAATFPDGFSWFAAGD